MSNVGQSIRNRFPYWSKIRKDSSSDSGIFLDSIGKYIEDSRISNYKMKMQQEPLHGNPVCEPGNLFIANVFESQKALDLLDEVRKLSLVDFIAIKDDEEISLRQTYNYVDLCNSLPTRLSVNSFENVSSRLLHLFDDNSLNHKHSNVYDFKIPKKICFNVYDSLEFDLIKDNKTEQNRILVSGIDVYGEPIQEYIHIYNEGYYETKNFFKKLMPLNREEKYNVVKADSIEVTGINAKIEVLQLPVRLGSKESKSLFSILEEDIVSFGNSLRETFLVTKLQQNVDTDNVAFSSIDNIHRFFRDRTEYQNEYTTIDSDSFDYVKYSQTLLNNFGQRIKIEDYCYDYQRNLITTVSRDNIIRWYDLKPEAFQTKEFERTKRVSYSIEAEKQRVSFNETLKIHVQLERNKGSIQNLFIARRTPSSVGGTDQFEFEYLQEDKSTWSTDLYVFKEEILLKNIKYFSSIFFDVTFDLFGQYDFYVFSCSSTRKNSIINKLLNNVITDIEFKKNVESLLEDNLQRELFINSYSVMCESLTPVLEIESPIDLSDEESYEIGIFYQNVENTLYITKEFDDRCEVNEIKEHKDYFIYDYENNISAFLEEYDSLTLLLENNEEDDIEVYKIRNSTTLDEISFKYGISRQNDERLNSFRERVYKLCKNSLDSEKYAFEKSLGCSTSLKDYDLFEIDLVDNSLDLNIEIKENRLMLFLNDEVFHNEKLSDLKFLFKVKEIFELYPNYFTIKELTDYDYRFFDAKNLMPKTSKRNYGKFGVNNFVNILPKENIQNIQDFSGLFVTNMGVGENVNTPFTFSLVENVLHKYSDELESVTFDYKDFPFVVKWLPIKAIAFNCDNMEDYLYDVKKDNENYGVISNGNLVENSEKNKVLSQKGAKIINSLLQKQNTYWGE